MDQFIAQQHGHMQAFNGAGLLVILLLLFLYLLDCFASLSTPAIG